MKRIHIVGRKNHGKATLIVDLVQAFCRRGIRVGTIKDSRHLHELDTPGKDSRRHRTAGSQPAAVISHDAVAVFLNRDGRTMARSIVDPRIEQQSRDGHNTGCPSGQRQRLREPVGRGQKPYAPTRHRSHRGDARSQSSGRI